MADAVKQGRWARRLTWIALILSVGGVVAALIAALGSGNGAWHFRVGFTVLRYAFFAAIAGGVLAIVALVLSQRAKVPGLRTRNVFAAAIALVFVIFLGRQIYTARTVPAIHDVTTDLEEVPEFRALHVREDNLENVPGQDEPELARLSPEDRWKALHREAYADVQPIRVSWTVPETIAKAQALADKRGWDIAYVDPARGRLEATDTTRFFRFKDDVVIRARKDPEGKGAIVDMRSISRVGGSDVGVNARRIREFLKDLRQS
ncbi:MAG TPA: DUF1499 domain-containing protein [Allosphingosinicella sp.]|uniref:DUF1499 domain-containing protein n=1 Tax=Allosphingosinicella sp. TaxID=2823234 RepID=UPI002EDBB5F3